MSYDPSHQTKQRPGIPMFMVFISTVNEGAGGYCSSNIKLKELNWIPDSIRNGKNCAWLQLQDKNGNLWFGGNKH
jgi:hypothetical protein